MNLLTHTCCGPCLTGSIEILKDKWVHGNISVFWDNPNIHPYLEYRNRFMSFKKACEKLNLNAYFSNIDYELNTFIKLIGQDLEPDKRCEHCYQIRFNRTAEFAKKNGYNAFTTTLLVSPYQNHDLICLTGEKIAFENKLDFFHVDLKPGFASIKEKSIELELYRQKYCGCIFSEYERYKNDKKYKISA